MRLKLDENLGHDAAGLLANAGHDVATVPEEGLTSASDRDLSEICRREHRCLVTLDLDFSNPLLFKPSAYDGIAVLRLPAKPSHGDLLRSIHTLVAGLSQRNISGKLWVIEVGRLREYQGEEWE